jgi:hypothetical protein
MGSWEKSDRAPDVDGGGEVRRHARWVGDIERATPDNPTFRTVLFTGNTRSSR